MLLILSTPTGDIDLHNNTTGFVIQDGLTTEPGRFAFTWLAKGADATEVAYTANIVQSAINQAATAASIDQAVTLITDLLGTDYPMTYHLTGGTMAARDRYTTAATYDIVLNCYPTARSEPYDVTVAGSLAGTSAAILVPGIPGTAPALMHLELDAAAAVNRIRLAVAPRDQGYTSATGFTAWHNAAIAGSASATTDATAVGGSYATLSGITSTAWQDLATVTPPSGSLYRGRRDGWLRVRGSGTALSQPGSLTNSVSAAVITNLDTQATTPAAAGISYIGTAAATPSTFTIPRTGATAGGTLLIVQFTSGSSGGSTTLSGTGTFTKVFDHIENTPVAQHLVVWIARNNTATTDITATVTGTTTSTTFYLFELLNLGTNPQIADVAYFLADAVDPSLSLTTGNTAGQVAVMINTAANVVVGYASQPSAALLGSTNNGIWVQVPEPYTNITMRPILSVSNGVAAAGFVLTVPTTTVPNSAGTEYQQPTPGTLFAGSYVMRVQAIDQAGYRSNATASSTATVTVDNSAVTASWTASTGALAYALTIQATISGRPVATYEVITSNTSYVLTTTDGLGQVAGLPALSGASAPPPLVRARIGTAGDTVYADMSEIAVADATNFRLQRLFTDRATPPVDAMLGGWADAKMIVQMRSANGLAATVNADALWLVPSSEPQAVIEVPGMGEGVARRFVIETHPSAKATTAWRVNTSTGAEAGRLTTFGAIALPPGDCILLIELELANGAHALATAATVNLLRVYPRHLLADWGGM
jgi:hypothetical protein